MQKNPRSFGTHDGTFHADEVTACALLLLFNLIDQNKIVRTRDHDILNKCEYVCDVGGIYDPKKMLFDHHQADYQGALSGAGMILLHLKNTDVINQKVYDFFNHSLILGVDAHDNGKEEQALGICTYSHVISNFTPIQHENPPEIQDAAFFEALHFALGHLKRLWERYQYAQSCRQIVADAMAKNNECLIFDKSLPWLELFFDMDGVAHSAEFVIMPSGAHWKLRGIPPTYDERMKVRHPLPKHWAGLLENDLKKVTGIPGAIFCHKGRFISVWETKDDALEALKLVINEKLKKKD